MFLSLTIESPYSNLGATAFTTSHDVTTFGRETPLPCGHSHPPCSVSRKHAGRPHAMWHDPSDDEADLQLSHACAARRMPLVREYR